MVMDMFYSHVETAKKKRVHFHGFMLDVHKSKFSLYKYTFFFVVSYRYHSYVCHTYIHKCY